jgi:tetratricopeptide (TPR) repeat protein
MCNDTPTLSTSFTRDLYKLTEKFRTRPDTIIIPAIFLLSFLLHALTTACTVTFSDSGDLLMAISTVGNCHGPGYPLYLMTAKLFSWLVPFGSLAFRVSLYSGIMASLTTCLIYWIVYRMSHSRLGCAIGARAYCFSYTFWYQTVIPETYSLTTFLTAALIIFALRWERQLEAGRKTSADNTLALFALFFGLALSNHFITIYLLPAFLFFALDTNWREIVALRNIVRMAVFFSLGLLPYLYVTTAAFRGPAYNYGDPSTLKRWFQHVTFYYQRGELFEYPLGLLGERFGRYFGTLNTEFPHFAWLGGLGFLSSLGMRKKKYPIFLLFLFILAVLPVMTYNQIESVLRAHFYYLSYMVFSLLIGLGAAFLISIVRRITERGDKSVEFVSISLIALVLLFCPAIAVAVHYKKVDKRNYYFASDMANNILETAGPGSVIAVDSDNVYFPCRYLQVVERKFPYVRVINPEAAGVPGFEGRDLLARITPGYQPSQGESKYVQQVQKNYKDLTVYSTLTGFIKFDWSYRWEGYLVQVLPEGSEPEGTSRTIYLRIRGSGTPYRDLDSDAREAFLFPGMLKANLDYARRDYQAASVVYREIINRFEINLYVPTLYSCETFTFMHEFEGQVLNAMGKYRETTILFPRVRIINPDYHSPTLARAYLETSQYPSAISELEGYLLSNPKDAEAYTSLGEFYFSLKEYDGAATELEKAVGIKSDNPKNHYLYGLALQKSGHNRAAVDQFKKTIQLGPNSEYAKTAPELLNMPGP